MADDAKSGGCKGGRRQEREVDEERATRGDEGARRAGARWRGGGNAQSSGGGGNSPEEIGAAGAHRDPTERPRARDDARGATVRRSRAQRETRGRPKAAQTRAARRRGAVGDAGLMGLWACGARAMVTRARDEAARAWWRGGRGREVGGRGREVGGARRTWRPRARARDVAAWTEGVREGLEGEEDGRERARDATFESEHSPIGTDSRIQTPDAGAKRSRSEHRPCFVYYSVNSWPNHTRIISLERCFKWLSNSIGFVIRQISAPSIRSRPAHDPRLTAPDNRLMIRQPYRRAMAQRDIEHDDRAPRSQPRRKKGTGEPALDSCLTVYKRPAGRGGPSEIDRYLAASTRVHADDPLQLVVGIAAVKVYPHLSRTALSYLTIPAKGADTSATVCLPPVYPGASSSDSFETPTSRVALRDDASDDLEGGWELVVVAATFREAPPKVGPSLPATPRFLDSNPPDSGRSVGRTPPTRASASAKPAGARNPSEQARGERAKTVRRDPTSPPPLPPPGAYLSARVGVSRHGRRRAGGTRESRQPTERERRGGLARARGGEPLVVVDAAAPEPSRAVARGDLRDARGKRARAPRAAASDGTRAFPTGRLRLPKRERRRERRASKGRARAGGTAVHEGPDHVRRRVTEGHAGTAGDGTCARARDPPRSAARAGP
ncbi:uncharacterized protein BXZ73DRAFT_78060 [Epithele typhae]|uniref:uncharacterized protein n=1 Tax=Epithele typhae TaxID=378194 RepID=UPI0020077C94|nr:uncharacterized protein BXZ73DRAFT_78060 [Epithele typhae]KAH9929959.1 hypothetical protein BXZ73DRAFT_78060 [Epithele typhae]